MAKLYDRDYFVVTPEELQQKAQIDAQRTPDRRYGHAVNVREYPKAIRHYESLFPNNFMDFVELQDREKLEQLAASFLEKLDVESITELDIKRMIKESQGYHIPASLLVDYNFGHHDTFLFPEFKLGTNFTADYLIVGNRSGGHQFLFVECESIYGRITVADGNFGEAITKGIRQINDWKDFLASNFSTITTEFQKYTTKQLPDEFYSFDPTRMNFAVVAGRRDNFNKRTYRLARQSKEDSKTSILHYDNLYDYSLKIIGNPTY